MKERVVSSRLQTYLNNENLHNPFQSAYREMHSVESALLRVNNDVLIGIRENGEKLLVKSADEYTSPISKIYKVETEYIIITENSIYVVSADIETKRVS